jgi:hypothetical protein
MTDKDLEKSQTPKYELLENAGKIVECVRCHAPCRVASARNVHGRPFQYGNGDGKGFCANCAVTEFLISPEIDISYLLPEGTDIRKALRAPHIQELFGQMLKVGMADLKDAEINWNAVIENWDLPFPKIKRPTKKQDDDWAEFIN